MYAATGTHRTGSQVTSGKRSIFGCDFAHISACLVKVLWRNAPFGRQYLGHWSRAYSRQGCSPFCRGSYWWWLWQALALLSRLFIATKVRHLVINSRCALAGAAPAPDAPLCIIVPGKLVLALWIPQQIPILRASSVMLLRICRFCWIC